MINPLISVVIGSYNQKDVLTKVLNSLFSQSLVHSSYEVIVIDSGSTDNTEEVLKAFSVKSNFSYEIIKNQGKAFARNHGVKKAKADLILITDADMIADKYLLENHLHAHEKIKNQACFEGLTYNLTKLEYPPKKENISPYIKRKYSNFKRLDWYYFLTGNLSFPKKIFLGFGGFSEKFTGYGWEDLELGYRFQKYKIPLYYLKTAQNYHYHLVEREDEIARNIKKGQGAKIFLDLHPELKLFLGINPISVGLFKLIKPQGKIYAFFHKNLNSPNRLLKNLSFYILKEHSYLSGLLNF
jgi:glycosyltransferase involved in cell wall biosynthesis